MRIGSRLIRHDLALSLFANISDFGLTCLILSKHLLSDKPGYIYECYPSKFGDSYQYLVGGLEIVSQRLSSYVQGERCQRR